jgi:hypothetical protein
VKRALAVALFVMLAGCSGSAHLSTADQVSMATKLARQACVGAPDVKDDGSATYDSNTSIAVYGSTSERDAELAKVKALGPGGFVKGGTWWIECDPANTARIVAATGGQVA